MQFHSEICRSSWCYYFLQNIRFISLVLLFTYYCQLKSVLVFCLILCKLNKKFNSLCQNRTTVWRTGYYTWLRGKMYWVLVPTWTPALSKVIKMIKKDLMQSLFESLKLISIILPYIFLKITFSLFNL